MHGDIRISQFVNQVCKRFQRAGINVVYGAAHQHQMLNRRVIRHRIQNIRFQILRVGEVQAFIHANGQHMGAGVNRVAQDIAEMFRVTNSSHYRDMGTAGAVQIKD